MKPPLKRRKTLLWILISGVSLALGLGPPIWIVIQWWPVPPPFDKKPFNRTVWLAASKRQDRSARADMTNDIVRHHLKAGMTESEVKSLLGEPDRLWEQGPPKDVFQYDMGPKPHDFERYVLRLTFDQSGHYIGPEITWD